MFRYLGDLGCNTFTLFSDRPAAARAAWLHRLILCLLARHKTGVRIYTEVSKKLRSNLTEIKVMGIEVAKKYNEINVIDWNNK